MKRQGFETKIDALQQHICRLQLRRTTDEAQQELLETLQISLEELQVAEEELRQQNEALVFARQAAEQEKQRYQELFDLAPDGYLVTDAQGVIQEANRAAVALLGVSERYLVGKPLAIFVVEKEQRSFRSQLHILSWAHRVDNWPVCLQRRDGDIRQTAITVVAGLNPANNLRSLRWALRDITKQAQMQTALNEREVRLASIINTAAVGIITSNMQGCIESFNPAAEGMFGYATAEMRGQPMALLLSPSRRQAYADFITHHGQAEASQMSGDRHEFTGQRKDGTTFPIDMSVSAVSLPDRRLLTSIVYDITQRKRDEQAIHQSQQQLRSLAVYLQRLQEEERTRIARELHDDMGQVLTSLKVDLAWLARRHAAPDEQSRLTEMQALLDTLTTTARRIGMELRPGLLDDLGLTAAMDWQMEDFQRRTGIACTLTLPAQEIALEAARATAVFRIFQEVLTNVVRHAEAHTATVRVVGKPKALCIAMTDDGKGITPAQVVHHASLGILGMRERAHMWGGEVTFEGQPGQGTTVTIQMPYGAADPGAAP